MNKKKFDEIEKNVIRRTELGIRSKIGLSKEELEDIFLCRYIEELLEVFDNIKKYIKNPNINVSTIRYNDIVNVKDELLKIIEEVE